MSYPNFFETLTGNAPFPYQERLASEPWPELLDVPTGLGKTAAIVGAWLWKRLHDDNAPRRLAYCLPMRVLVEQTAEVARELCARSERYFEHGAVPSVHVLMGGDVDEAWEGAPDASAILVGTQDMLISRALNRGYGMSRFKWPVHFGLLHNDCLWALDETQLMGVAVETSAQLEGLRRRLGTLKPAKTVWMSATLAAGQLETVDHPIPDSGRQRLTLSDSDRTNEVVRSRLSARKTIARLEGARLTGHDKTDAEQVFDSVLDLHNERGGLTLVVANTVARAQALFDRLAHETDRISLVHSRFRPVDRLAAEQSLFETGDRIVVATQAIEAGVDISARTLITDLAPWPSLVQRFGRLNRYGEREGLIRWIDADLEKKNSKSSLPYDTADLETARHLLRDLQDAGPGSLAQIPYSPPAVVRPVLRRRDLLDLFDTSSDLLGEDLDVSRWVRDERDTDVQFYWRSFEGSEPPSGIERPQRTELCRVSIGAANGFLNRLRSSKKKPGGVKTAFRWNALEGAYEPVRREQPARPGELLLLPVESGGYDPERGWHGQPKSVRVPEIQTQQIVSRESYAWEPQTAGAWLSLEEHLRDVVRETVSLTEALGLVPEHSEALRRAAQWHDVGKAHDQFQRRLLEPVADRPNLQPPSTEELWAKSSHRRQAPGLRRYFRHELASALAWLEHADENDIAADLASLVAFLIAGHHGKVRLSIRSVPDEDRPSGKERLFARGVWHGDRLPECELPEDGKVGPFTMDLSVMQLGRGSWLSRMLELRDSAQIGPFRLGLLEATLRAADWRGSASPGTAASATERS
ncbi:MAG: CRISPR-associated helicase Cas3' [Acidobacteriota bacterium]